MSPDLAGSSPAGSAAASDGSVLLLHDGIIDALQSLCGANLLGVEVLEHSPSGRRGNFDRDSADAVVKADPTKFRLVPPSQYRTTD